MKEKHDVRAKTKIFWEGGLKTRSLIRGFELETDKPKSDFGTNTAPAPMEVFISGMGACVLSTFIWATIKARITIEDCIVDVKANTNIHENKEQLSKAKIILTVWAEKNYKDRVEQCFNITKTNCPLTNAVSFSLENIMIFKENK